LNAAYKVGQENKQAGAMTQAVMGIAKLHGLLIDRGELTGKDGGPIKTDPGMKVVTSESVKAEIMDIFRKHGRKNSETASV